MQSQNYDTANAKQAQGLQGYAIRGRGEEIGSNARYLLQIDSIRQQAHRQRRPLILHAFTTLYYKRGGGVS